ncbi:chromosome partition protein Smc [Thermosporothrix hazakensis]|jgi:chromosome segregation protein|nr:chromosome partition protein Smc [Thermosporothrix hazakensis]
MLYAIIRYIWQYLDGGLDQAVYLKRLEMLGFKSFAARTVLEFSPGITAVVGPNGAGKSNVADSMRWVLGEQSMRQLRGKKSDDIIFAGGHGRAALGMAEVSLTIDNSTGWIPSEYSEITVTRRSYRSGENEYLINKRKVRLKDVLLLLAQARIGHDSYTVIGQGMIDATLSLRAEERRGLFEDAAGIRPYQVQRTDAENRLRQTEQNLERVRDIVSEIEPRLAPLKEQARKALEYKQLTTELQDVLLSWYALQWRRLLTTKELTEQREQEQARKMQQLEGALQEANERSELLRSARQQTQGRIAEVRRLWNEAYNQVQKIERELAVNEERLGGLDRQRAAFQQEERRLRERLIAVQKQTIDLEEQCDLAEEAVDNGSARLATLEAEVAKAQKEYEMDERRLRGAQNDLIQLQARLGSSQTELGRLQKQLGERNRTLAARRETIARAQHNLQTIEARLQTERQRLEEERSEEQKATQRRQAVQRSIAEAQQEYERLKNLLAEAERRRRTLSDRLNMLKQWRQSLSGYSDGVRALLRAPTEKLRGLIGPVPQLGVVSEGMEQAIEAALGSYMQAVVVQTLEDALNCREYLKTSRAGKAMLLWLEREGEDEVVSQIQGEVEEAILQRFLAEKPQVCEGVCGFAWQLVQCEPRFRPLFRRLLRGAVVVQDLAIARELMEWVLQLSISSDSDLPFTSVVTLQGDALHVDGWLSGGDGKDGGQQGLLAYERELRALPAQLEEQKEALDQLNTLMSEIQRAQEGRRAEQNALDKLIQKLGARIHDLNRGVQGSQRELERLQTEIQLSASVEQQLAAEVAGLEQELVAVQERVQQHEKSQRELQGIVEELQYEMEERATAYRRRQDELNRERTALAVKRQEAKSLQQQLVQQQALARDLRSQVDQQVTRAKEVEQSKQELLTTLERLRDELGQAREKANMLATNLQTVEAQLADVEQHIAAIDRERMQLQQRKNEQENIYRRSLLECQRARDAVETLLTQLQEEMGIEDPQELSRYANREDETGDGQLTEEEETRLRKLRRRVDSLRSRLKAMGGCDENAPQLYEETRIRHEFLTTQIADLEQASQQLHSIIEQLDATMARQFEATFRAVNERFKEHFTTLFNGGMARLELVTSRNEDAPAGMPTGVEVIVQPPGKKVQDLSLLSGGERALVAAALLFSLLEINPPPFCLLDEVDAALDESNVTRFCDILRRMSQKTQFIVITHNRVTMTTAQVIYGVSMRNSASSILSLRLEEAVAAGER